MTDVLDAMSKMYNVTGDKTREDSYQRAASVLRSLPRRQGTLATVFVPLPLERELSCRDPSAYIGFVLSSLVPQAFVCVIYSLMCDVCGAKNLVDDACFLFLFLFDLSTFFVVCGHARDRSATIGGPRSDWLRV